MTRVEIENYIIKKLEEIRDTVRKEYNPDNDYLSICIRGDSVAANNSYWEADNVESKFPINTWKYADGVVEHHECRIKGQRRRWTNEPVKRKH